MTDDTPKPPRPVTALTPADDAPDTVPDTALDAHGYDPADYDWVPVLRKPRADGWTPDRQRAFIGHLADTGSVATAAQRVGMSAAGAYALRRAPGGETFAAAWDSAMQQAAHVLIDAAFERAINGSEEPVYNREGQVVGRRFRQSDGLMMFMLRKHFPERYGDLHRDRPERQVAPPAPAVAETLVALGPVPPADPVALMHPDDAAIAMECADILNGALPRRYRPYDEAAADAGLGEAFEATLAAAKMEADPEGHAAAAERREAMAADEPAARKRRRR
ncbi:MAG: hypothetical protein J0I47_07410 [Sphingomonas sp.]|uniref:hypothetical protein n=1 Tax=Sphingomonas sp. TaxID=28214 RepID=UPI001ACC1D81|nr:hypothetical protein [Sphingomonas sp.]MBN8808050.1 hypothetical protein [Sphingomonas sp.]